jgi:hypothetical protein
VLEADWSLPGSSSSNKNGNSSSNKNVMAGIAAVMVYSMGVMGCWAWVWSGKTSGINKGSTAVA